MSGILSDKEIKQLCMQPTFMVTRMVPTYQDPNNDMYFLPHKETRPTHMSEEELRKLPTPNAINGNIGLLAYSPLTDEQKANWPVMISPFVDHQVKTLRRELNAEEKRIWNNANHNSPLYFPEPNIDNFVLNEGDPYIEEKVISYGVSSYGYDLRIAPEFKIFTNINSSIVDPKKFDKKSFVDFEGDYCIVPPNSFVLARSLEYFNVPKDVCGIVIGKSTYARTGINCLCTPIEPGWKGYLTLEFANTTPLPAKIYANEGGCQVMWFRGNPPDITYDMRGGKYQNQEAEITLPKA